MIKIVYEISIRCASALEQGFNFGFYGSECLEMVPLLGAFHAFGGEDAAQCLFSEKLRDDCAGDAVVHLLFVFWVDLILFGSHAVELPESVLIDVVVHLAADQLLEEVIAF